MTNENDEEDVIQNKVKEDVVQHNVKEDVPDPILSDDSEYEDDNNESQNPGVSNEFKDIILTAKKALYDSIVLGPKIETPDAQNIILVEIYINKLNEFYKLIHIKNNEDIMKKLEIFPIQSRDSIQKAVMAIQTFFKMNTSIQDRIPYENYLNYIFKKYQFVFKKRGEVE